MPRKQCYFKPFQTIPHNYSLGESKIKSIKAYKLRAFTLGVCFFEGISSIYEVSGCIMFTLHVQVKMSSLRESISCSWKEIFAALRNGCVYRQQLGKEGLVRHLPHQFLAILYMLAALTYMSQASSNLEEPL